MQIKDQIYERVICVILYIMAYLNSQLNWVGIGGYRSPFQGDCIFLLKLFNPFLFLLIEC